MVHDCGLEARIVQRIKNQWNLYKRRIEIDNFGLNVSKMVCFLWYVMYIGWYIRQKIAYRNEESLPFTLKDNERPITSGINISELTITDILPLEFLYISLAGLCLELALLLSPFGLEITSISDDVAVSSSSAEVWPLEPILMFSVRLIKRNRLERVDKKLRNQARYTFPKKS